MTLACNFYRQQLRGARPAIDYLKGRGLTGEIAAKYGIGYAPDGWDSLRQVFTDYENEALVESGLIIDRSDEDNSQRKRYDRFRDRIMFPIRNTKGQVIGFGGRVMGAGEPKYLNSPETPLFQKGSELYGLFEAWQAIRDKDYVLVTEGYMDVVALAQYGFEQAVATLGTACTATHVQKLLRQTDNVIFSFDGDAAGRRAARRALEACLPHASDSRALKFLFLPTEHDPDSYVREHGTSQFERLVQDATPLSQFLINEVTEGKDLSTAEGRARAQFDAKPLMQAMPPSALRLQVLRQLAQVTDSTPQELEGLFELAASRSPSRAPGPAVRRKPPVELERQVLRLLLAHPGMHDVLDNLALDLIAQTAPDEGVTLRAVVQAAAGLPAGASLGVLSEALRAQGVELGSLIAEIAAEPMSEPDLARKELSGAIRQTRMKSLKAELERLAATGLGSDTDKVRYREISVELEKLRAASDKEGRD